MIDARNSRKSLKQMSILGAALVAVGLSVGSVRLALSSAEGGTVSAMSFVNPFALTQAPAVVLKQNERDRQRVDQARQRLSFMTFTPDRQRESKVVANWLREKINRSPFDATNWLELLSVEADAQRDVGERVWVAQSALLLGGWNNEYRLRVMSHCLETPPLLFKGAPTFCKGLLAHMPYADLPSNARGMGIKFKLLEFRLRQLEREFGFKSASGPKKSSEPIERG